MEQTDNLSASRIPKILTLSTMLLLITRLAVFSLENHLPPESGKKHETPSLVSWIDLTENLRESIKSVHQKEARESIDDKNLTKLCAHCKSRFNPSTTVSGKERDERIARVLEDYSKSILAKSKTEKKYVLYEFYGKDSQPCQRMDSTSFSNTQVADLISKNFTPVKVTYKKNETRDVGNALVDFRRHYKVFAFPTLVVVDHEGETVTNLVGNCSSLTTYRFLSRTMARVKTVPVKKIASYKPAYLEERRGMETLLQR